MILDLFNIWRVRISYQDCVFEGPLTILFRAPDFMVFELLQLILLPYALSLPLYRDFVTFLAS